MARAKGVKVGRKFEVGGRCNNEWRDSGVAS